MIHNRLKEIREQRGVAVARLAREVGVQRQTIYAIEAGEYVPNTLVSLHLAKALQVSVEELFQLPDDDGAASRTIRAELLTAAPVEPARSAGVRLCRVHGTDFAAPVEPEKRGLPAVDGVIRSVTAKRRAEIEVYDDPRQWESRLLVAGCDPATSLLARDVERAAGGDVVLAPCSSRTALEWLRDKKVHVAGAHLRDPKSGEFNLPEIARLFPDGDVTVLTFAHWDEGIVTAPGNPKSIRSVEDFARSDVRLINREPGAGSRRLLDRSLQACGVTPEQVSGYDSLAYGHFEAAEAVREGSADACIAGRYAAVVYGLNFQPLQTERYDLAARTSDLRMPLMKALLDALNTLSLRKKLSGVAGYDTAKTGARVC